MPPPPLPEPRRRRPIQPEEASPPRRQPPHRRDNTLAAVLVLAGVLGVALLAGGGAWLFLRGRAKPVPQKPQPRTKWDDIEQVRQAVVGKTPDEVIAIMGRPGVAHGDAWGESGEWVYYRRLFNRATNEHDGDYRIVFVDGKATEARKGWF